MVKKCTCCREDKSLDQFDVKTCAKDGRKSRCKQCQKDHYNANRERILTERKQKRDSIKDTPQYKEKRQQEYNRNKTTIQNGQKLYREANAEKIKEGKRQYYQDNREQILAKERDERLANPEKHATEARKRRQKNLEARRAYDRNYSKQRRENDLQYRILGNLRNRIRLSIQNKSECTAGLLGCDLDHFVKRLESQFTPKMNWDNYGDYWSIDHIEPCCSFDLSDPEQQRKCFHWSNCRPLPKSENSRKGNTTDREKMRKVDKTPKSSVLDNNQHNHITISS